VYRAWFGKKTSFLVLAAVWWATACGNSTSSSVTGPTADRCHLTLAAQPTSIQAAGGRGIVTISTNRECAWEAESDADWLQFDSQAKGQGTGTLGYNAANNPLAAPRRGAFMVNGYRLDVSQAGLPCVVTLGERGRAVGASGGGVDIDVAAPPGCAWSTVSLVSWVVAVAGANGSGPGGVRLQVAANIGNERRSTSVSIGGQTYGIEQDAAALSPEPPGHPPAPTPEPPPPSPAPTPEPGPSPSPGPGPTPPPTPGPAPPPTPGPAPPPTPGPAPPPPPNPPPEPGPTSCRYTVLPSRIDVGPDRAEVDVEVTAAAGCSWTGTSEFDWIRFDGRRSGTGSDRVRLAIDENEAAPTRSGTALVAGQLVMVNQAGRQPSGETRIEGRVTDIRGACPVLTFGVEGRAVVTGAGTKFTKECAEVVNGATVEVRGETQPNGQILASRVQVKK
jgi:hypothetical protein